MLSGDCDGHLKAWDAQSARCFRSLPRAHKAALHCISTNHDASLVLTSAIDGSIALWDFSSFQHMSGSEESDDTEIAGQDPPMIALPVDDAASLLTAQLDSLLAAPSGSTKLSEAWKTVLHPTLPIFASVGAGRQATLHSAKNDGDSASFGALLCTANADTSSSASKEPFGLCLTFNATGTLLAVGSSTGEVLLYACRNQTGYVLEVLAKYADHPSPVRALSMSPGHLYVGGDDRILTIHDVRSLQDHPHTSPDPGTQSQHQAQMGGTVAAMTGHKGWILSTAPVPSSTRLVASISMDRTIRFWDLAVNPKSCICTCTELDTIRAFSFQPVAPSAPNQAPARAGTAPTSIGGFGTSSKFVTASNDGKLRWYRSAGI